MKNKITLDDYNKKCTEYEKYKETTSKIYEEKVDFIQKLQKYIKVLSEENKTLKKCLKGVL